MKTIITILIIATILMFGGIFAFSVKAFVLMGVIALLVVPVLFAKPAKGSK